MPSSPQPSPSAAPRPDAGPQRPADGPQRPPVGPQRPRRQWKRVPDSPRDPILYTPQGYPTTLRNDGRIAWVMGLLGCSFLVLFTTIPVHTVITGLTMVVVGLMQRGKNPVARAVGTRAALFGGVMLLLSPLLVLAWIPTALVAIHAPPSDGPLWVLASSTLGLIIYGLVGVGLPLIAIMMAAISLLVPVSADRAAQIIHSTRSRR